MHFSVFIGMGLTCLIMGCSSAPVAVAPVGPNPVGLNYEMSNGQLEVFSALIGRSEGNNPCWYQHAGYTVYSAQGLCVKHADNTVGHYEQRPRLVSLPLGKYFVRAGAKDYLSVKVPVVIEAGRVTKVHLDDA